MLNAYYFETNSMRLAAVYAKTEAEAWAELPKQHSWCYADRSNCTLANVKEGTEWERICATPPRNRVFVMAVSFMLCFMVSAVSAQTKQTKVLVADETTYSDVSDKKFKVITSNDSIAKIIFKQFAEDILSYSVLMKHDRLGMYHQYTIYLPMVSRNRFIDITNKL